MNWKSFGFRRLLEDGEEVKQVFRSSGTVYVIKVAMILLLTVGAVFFVWFFFPRDLVWVPLMPIFPGIYFIAGVIARFWSNALLMTSESLVFIEFERLYFEKISRIDYIDLDGIEIERQGPRDYLANFGTLNFAKVGGGEVKVLPNVFNPRKVVKIIMEHKAKIISAKNFTDESALKELISGMVMSQSREHGAPSEDDPLPAKAAEGNSATEKIAKKRRFHNTQIEVEKELDDEGGLGFDL